MARLTLRGFTMASAAMVAALVLACSTSSPVTVADAAAMCPNDLPESCPSPIPSYATDVEPILAAHCTGCHSTTGVAGHPLTTYAGVYGQRSAVLDQVYQCTMPPIGSSQLTVQQRVTLMDWLVCNAPDN